MSEVGGCACGPTCGCQGAQMAGHLTATEVPESATLDPGGQQEPVSTSQVRALRSSTIETPEASVASGTLGGGVHQELSSTSPVRALRSSTIETPGASGAGATLGAGVRQEPGSMTLARALRSSAVETPEASWGSTPDAGMQGAGDASLKQGAMGPPPGQVFTASVGQSKGGFGGDALSSKQPGGAPSFDKRGFNKRGPVPTGPNVGLFLEPADTSPWSELEVLSPEELEALEAVAAENTVSAADCPAHGPHSMGAEESLKCRFTETQHDLSHPEDDLPLKTPETPDARGKGGLEECECDCKCVPRRRNWVDRLVDWLLSPFRNLDPYGPYRPPPSIRPEQPLPILWHDDPTPWEDPPPPSPPWFPLPPSRRDEVSDPIFWVPPAWDPFPVPPSVRPPSSAPILWEPPSTEEEWEDPGGSPPWSRGQARPPVAQAVDHADQPPIGSLNTSFTPTGSRDPTIQFLLIDPTRQIRPNYHEPETATKRLFDDRTRD